MSESAEVRCEKCTRGRHNHCTGCVCDVCWEGYAAPVEPLAGSPEPVPELTPPTSQALEESSASGDTAT